MTELATVAPAQRLPLIERRGLDFPYYNGVPVALSPRQWLALLLSVVIGLGALISPIAGGPIVGIAKSLMFLGFPLFILSRIAPGTLGALYRRIEPRDWLVLILCLFLGFVASGLTAFFILNTMGAAGNPIFGALESGNAGTLALMAVTTLIQLPGEELLAIIPFLAILAWLHGSVGLSRRTAIIIAWIGSSVIFGMAHLPTYDWNWVQCIVVIGTARVVLTLAYVITKNLWISTILHIVNDWTLFAVGMAADAAA